MNLRKFLISYDITSDRNRKKISDLLKKEGVRIQYSVFECGISLKKLNETKKKINKIINQKTDSVLIYSICDKCEEKKIMIGKQYFLKFQKIVIF